MPPPALHRQLQRAGRAIVAGSLHSHSTWEGGFTPTLGHSGAAPLFSPLKTRTSPSTTLSSKGAEFLQEERIKTGTHFPSALLQPQITSMLSLHILQHSQGTSPQSLGRARSLLLPPSPRHLCPCGCQGEGRADPRRAERAGRANSASSPETKHSKPDLE